MQEKKRDLGQWICHASHLFRRRMDNSVAAAMGADADEVFSGRNLWVLRYMKEHEGEEVYQRDLEKAFHLRRSTISNVIDRMVQKQYLARESVEGDRRLKRLRLTEKGEQVRSEVAHSVDELEAGLKREFTEAEYAELILLLGRLCNSLEPRPEADKRKEPEINHE